MSVNLSALNKGLDRKVVTIRTQRVLVLRNIVRKCRRALSRTSLFSGVTRSFVFPDGGTVLSFVGNVLFAEGTGIAFKHSVSLPMRFHDSAFVCSPVHCGIC